MGLRGTMTEAEMMLAERLCGTEQYLRVWQNGPPVSCFRAFSFCGGGTGAIFRNHGVYSKPRLMRGGTPSLSIVVASFCSVFTLVDIVCGTEVQC